MQRTRQRTLGYLKTFSAQDGQKAGDKCLFSIQNESKRLTISIQYNCSGPSTKLWTLMTFPGDHFFFFLAFIFDVKGRFNQNRTLSTNERTLIA